MHFELIIVFVGVLLLNLFAYRQGIRDAMNAKQERPPAPITTKVPGPDHGPKRANDKELSRLTKIEANLAAYDGTSKNQRKI